MEKQLNIDFEVRKTALFELILTRTKAGVNKPFVAGYWYSLFKPRSSYCVSRFEARASALGGCLRRNLKPAREPLTSSERMSVGVRCFLQPPSLF